MPSTKGPTTRAMLPALALTLLALTGTCHASYAFYVGKNLTTDGSVLLGGTGEEVSSHHLQLFPERDHPANATKTVGVTSAAVFPGNLLEIPEARHTYRYLSMEYTDFEGFPAPLTNGGLNEKGVAVRDVWAPSRSELEARTPDPQTGLQYSDLARIVLERAATAREGVEIIGDLIAKHGYATYGGNSHLIADRDEGWVVWEFAGGQKLWAAERLGENDVRVSFPGYIEDFPLDFADADQRDYLGSPNIVSFAVEQGWWDPEGNSSFNIWKAYGDGTRSTEARNGGRFSQALLENDTLALAPLNEEKLMTLVRDVRIADDEAGYGQVVALGPGEPDALLHRIWIAPTGSVSAPFVPWWVGVGSIPPEYGQHRYLTHEASSTFLNPDFQLQEASEFAGRVYKRVMYYMCSNPKLFHPVVTEMMLGFEAQSRADVEGWVETGARALIAQGLRQEARDLLTFYSHARARAALELGNTLADALDAQIKLTGQWRDPVGTEINQPWSDRETVSCRPRSS